VQEAALQALRGFDSFQEGTNFKAWFFRILTNCLLCIPPATARTGIDFPDLEDAPALYLFKQTRAMGMHAWTPIRPRWYSRDSRRHKSAELSPHCLRTTGLFRHLFYGGVFVSGDRGMWVARRNRAVAPASWPKDAAKGLWHIAEQQASSPICAPAGNSLGNRAMGRTYATLCPGHLEIQLYKGCSHCSSRLQRYHADPA
jgi:hypothetical protein